MVWLWKQEGYGMDRTREPMVLNKIPVTTWVCGTADKMRERNTEAISDWNRFWIETYREPGGTSDESGAKGCPKAAAYGLWYLGRVRHGKRPAQPLTGREVNRVLGKNAAYAVIAVELLRDGATRSPSSLWPLVQARYAELTHESPADSEQGEIRLVVALFCEQQLTD
jgi:hypothetical protein